MDPSGVAARTFGERSQSAVSACRTAGRAGDPGDSRRAALKQAHYRCRIKGIRTGDPGASRRASLKHRRRCASARLYNVNVAIALTVLSRRRRRAFRFFDTAPGWKRERTTRKRRAPYLLCSLGALGALGEQGIIVARHEVTGASVATCQVRLGGGSITRNPRPSGSKHTAPASAMVASALRAKCSRFP